MTPTTAATDALAALASFAQAGRRAAHALLDGHSPVVLLGEAAETDAMLVHATATLARRRVAVHVAAPARFGAADLLQPGGEGVLLLPGAERLDAAQWLLMEAHLRRAPRERARARILLAGTEALRARTAFPDLATLHRAALLIDPPVLAPTEAGALLAALAPRHSARTRAVLTELAGGHPALLLLLARVGRPRRALLRAASTPVLTHPLAHPLTLAVLSCPVLAAVLLLQAPRGAGPRDASAPSSFTAAAPGGAAAVFAPDPAPTDAGTGVEVDHETAEQAAAEAAAHEPRLLPARAGDTLAGMYRRVYRGLSGPPPFASVEAVNPVAPAAGVPLVFPAPRGGWPRP